MVHNRKKNKKKTEQQKLNRIRETYKKTTLKKSLPSIYCKLTNALSCL